MADKTAIEWTDATWNPIIGCSIVSPGCIHCYAMRTAGARTKHTAKYEGLTEASKAGPVWNGEVRFWERALLEPLRWREPRRVFVNSMGDLFHEAVPDEWIDRVFAVMALAPQHQFQVLTKRAERMRAYVAKASAEMIDGKLLWQIPDAQKSALRPWPLPNVWLGVSAERQEEADARIPLLLDTPAAIRFVSFEPLLGPIEAIENFGRISIRLPKNPTPPIDGPMDPDTKLGDAIRRLGGSLTEGPKIHWVIVGGESGPRARPMHPAWARSLRDQCEAAGVPFLFKQWGEWHREPLVGAAQGCFIGDRFTTDIPWNPGGVIEGATCMARVGKKAAGRLLDGREWSQIPETRR